MNPKDGPGIVDVLVVIISPLIAVVVMVISIMGYLLLFPWGSD